MRILVKTESYDHGPGPRKAKCRKRISMGQYEVVNEVLQTEKKMKNKRNGVYITVLGKS